MSMQDPIADMLNRIRNAAMASIENVSLPSSKIRAGLAEVLKKEGFIKDYRVEGEVPNKSLKIDLKYYKNEPVIEGMKRISKPSCRVYCGSKDIPKVRNGLGIVILSTPKGLVSDKKAKELNVGGEVLCYIW